VKPGDLQFLCKSTSLSEGKLLSLVEEDFINVIDALTDADFKTAPISLELFTRLTIFKETKECDFPLSEKAYVSDCVSIHYPRLFKTSHYLIDKKELDESAGQHYLVLTGMFPEFIMYKSSKKGAPGLTFYTGLAKQAFKFADRSELADHVNDWIDLLYYIKNYCWY